MEKLTKQEALYFISRHPEETVAFYMQETGLSPATIYNYKKQIKEKGLTLDSFSRDSSDELAQENKILVQANADLIEKIRILTEENNMLKEQPQESSSEMYEEIQSLRKKLRNSEDILHIILDRLAIVAVKLPFDMFFDWQGIDILSETFDSKKEFFKKGEYNILNYIFNGRDLDRLELKPVESPSEN